MCSVSTLLDRASASFDSLWTESVLDKVGFMLETKPSFFEASTTPPSVLPASVNFAYYKHGSWLVELVEAEVLSLRASGARVGIPRITVVLHD